MKNKLLRYFRGISLRQRFLVTPLLALAVCSLLTLAFVYEFQRQNALLSRITERDLTAFKHYSELFVNLTEHHTAFYDLLYSSGKIDEATLYDQTKQHLYKVQQAVRELEHALPPINDSASPDFATLRNELSNHAQAYKKGLSAAVEIVPVNLALVRDQLAHADERYTAMNRSFVKLLDLQREGISGEINARVRQSETSSTIIALLGVSIAALLFFLSQALSRMLSRSIETQIAFLTDLGAQAGARFAIEGNDEVERMTQAIAAFRQSLLELRESDRRFSDLLQNVALISLMLDREARITYCNEYLLNLTGWRHEEVIGRSWFEVFIPPEANDAQENFAALLANLPEARHHEREILTRSGQRRLIRWNNSVLQSGSGDVIGTASIGEDITEQKRAEIRITRLNRVYAVLSGINTLIVRVCDRDELFKEACRIAVENGGFRMALISLVDPGVTKVIPVASAGVDEELLSAIKARLSSSEAAPSTMIAQALREKKAIVSNDSLNDSRVLFGQKYAEAGVRSMAILPLIVANEGVGVLALYGTETEFFDEEEIKLLTELAGDISFAIDHIDKQERLDYVAYYDALTGLANRALFHERLQQSVVVANKQGGKLALVLLDIERFKTINDTLGRQAGDALLKDVAARMSGYAAADVGRLARKYADHFALMVPDVQSAEELARRVEQWVGEVFGPPFRIGDSELRVSAKVGIAIFPSDGDDPDTLVRNAEAALKKAKASGERYLFYTQTMNERVAEKLSLENKLRQALDNEEFVLHYQPKVNLLNGKVTSAEALIRWNDPRAGLVPPGLFISILEETGLIYEVGRWALRKAIEDNLRWRAAGLASVRVAVNVSALQLRNRGFIADIEQAIAIDAHAAAGLELEITESLIMEDIKYSTATLEAIRAMGISIAIDDFGTGFSSLSYLSKLPVDTLKIDRSFVIDMTSGPQGMALVSTIINLAHSLKLKVVAEGVETEEQSRLLRMLTCEEMQGYLFSEPLPVEIFERKYLTLPRSVTLPPPYNGAQVNCE